MKVNKSKFLSYTFLGMIGLGLNACTSPNLVKTEKKIPTNPNYFSLEDVKNSSVILRRETKTAYTNVGSGNVFGNKLYTAAHNFTKRGGFGPVRIYKEGNLILKIEEKDCKFNHDIDFAVCNVPLNYKMPKVWNNQEIESLLLSTRYNSAQKLDDIGGFYHKSNLTLNSKNKEGMSGGSLFAFNSQTGYSPIGTLESKYSQAPFVNTNFVIEPFKSFKVPIDKIKEPPQAWRKVIENI